MSSFYVVTVTDGRNFIKGAEVRAYVINYPIVKAFTDDQGKAIVRLLAPPEAWGRYWVEWNGRTATGLAQTAAREVDASINIRFGPEDEKPKGCCFA